MSKISPRILILTVVVVVLVVAGVVVLANGKSSKASSDDQAAADIATDTTVAGGDSSTSATDGSAGTSTTTTDPSLEVMPKEPVAQAIPLNVSVSNTTGLRDGDTVTVHVVPKPPGTVVYGFEMFICAPDQTFQLDADIRPTYTGKCITQALSASSGDYTKVAAAAPYTVADGSIKVGVGTNSYTTQQGKPVTIQCGPGHPCQLVLKLQFQDAYGFQAYPLTFR
jgi:hypothetical protein